MLKNKLFKLMFLLLPLSAVLLVLCGAVLAADVTLSPPITITNPDGTVGGAGIEDIIGKVTGVIFWLAIMICPLVIIWGGFEIATAAGDSNKVAHGKQIIFYSIGGLAIIGISAALVNVIKTVLGAP